VVVGHETKHGGAQKLIPSLSNTALCMEGGAINANRLQQQRQQTESADSAQCLLPHNTDALRVAT